MASGGGSPGGRDRKAPKKSSLSEPRPKKRPVPRFDTSFDTELSLNTELRRAEDTLNYRSLPNNLVCTFAMSMFILEKCFCMTMKNLCHGLHLAVNVSAMLCIKAFDIWCGVHAVP